MRHNGNGERRPDEIEAEIARTRTDMHATLTAIEQRLTPGQLIDQGLDYLRHSGGREFASNLSGSVKNNPIPVALMSIGMAWLMATGNRRPSYLERGKRGAGGLSSAKESFSSAKESFSSAKESLSSSKERLSEGLSSARDRLSGTAQSARERVGQLGESARYRMEQMRGGYDSIVREQPLVLGAIGLAVGALLGAGLPRTRQEDELMGEASDRLTEKAKEAGREQLEKAKQVASAAKDTLMQDKPTSQGTQAAGRPLVVEPARQTPLDQGVKPKDPRLGTP
jgi:ElaB/YqjD/DUF883 family membrane-anchored ribosome-binding protein